MTQSPQLAWKTAAGIGLGPQWIVAIDDVRGGEWGADSFDAALELIRTKWAEIERARAAEAEARERRI